MIENNPLMTLLFVALVAMVTYAIGTRRNQ